MGPITSEVVSVGSAPDLDEICTAIVDVCSLTVAVVETDHDDLFDLNASIAFECEQSVKLELTAYKPEALEASFKEEFKNPVHAEIMIGTVQGAAERAGTQTIYLSQQSLEEPTLMKVTQLALESLGGKSSWIMSIEACSEYNRPIDATELFARYRKSKRESIKHALIMIIMQPFLIPMWFLYFIWSIISAPYSIRKAKRLIKEMEGKSGANDK